MRFIRGNLSVSALLAAAALVVVAVQGYAQQGTGTGTVTGAVTEQLNGTAVPSARILLGTTNRAATTNAAGHYTLAAVPPGSYALRIIAVGFATQTRQGQGDAGGSAPAAFPLPRSVTTLEEVVSTVTGDQRAREICNAMPTTNLPKAIENQTVPD